MMNSHRLEGRPDQQELMRQIWGCKHRNVPSRDTVSTVESAKNPGPEETAEGVRE